MPISVRGYDGLFFDQRSIVSDGRFIRTVHKLVFTGAYPTGGDTLDWTNGGVNSAVPAAQSQGSAGPARVSINDNAPSGTSLLGAGGDVVPIVGSGLTNWLLKLFKNSAGSVAEYPAGAYSADVLTDVIIIEAWWPR